MTDDAESVIDDVIAPKAISLEERVAALEARVQMLEEMAQEGVPGQPSEQDLDVWTPSEEEAFLNDRLALSKNGRYRTFKIYDEKKLGQEPEHFHEFLRQANRKHKALHPTEDEDTDEAQVKRGKRVRQAKLEAAVRFCVEVDPSALIRNLRKSSMTPTMTSPEKGSEDEEVD